MPELPEVESIKLKLQDYLVGHIIEKVEIKFAKIFEGSPKDAEGQKIITVRRFAKVLSIDLANGQSLVIHIKLTGQLLYRGPNLRKVPPLSNKVVGGVPGPHTHVIFHLDKNGFLYYNDIRRFGWIRVIPTKEVENTGFVGKLGPEPFAGLTLSKFQEILSKSRRAIKVVLMDQARIGGVGNIYANDSLWLSKIHPEKKANELSPNEAKKLYDALISVLKEGLKYGGSSELAYVRPDGTEGEYQRHTLAYGHQGKVCGRCKKGIFKKYFLSGRGTYICPVCQNV